jgi:hypothetical protein
VGGKREQIFNHGHVHLSWRHASSLPCSDLSFPAQMATANIHKSLFSFLGFSPPSCFHRLFDIVMSNVFNNIFILIYQTRQKHLKNWIFP